MADSQGNPLVTESANDLDGRSVFSLASEILAKLITVDGSGSGLDADLLDGSHASAFGDTRAASDETISGDWDFTGNPSFPGMDIHNVKEYGALGNGSNDDSTAINSAITDAKASGGIVFIPAGNFACDEDIVIDGDNVTIMGVGDGTLITLNDVKVHVDARSTDIDRFKICNLRIQQATGNTGTALHLEGGGAGVGAPTRFILSNLNIRGGAGTAGSRAGTCITLEGVQIGSIKDVFLRSASVGIAVVPSSGNFGAYSVTFEKVDTLAIDNAFNGEGVSGCNFFGSLFQTSETGGVDLYGLCRGVGFYNCWFENNKGFDIRLGNSGTGCRGVTIRDGFFNDSAAAKDHSLSLVRSLDTIIKGNFYTGYTAEAIDVQEASPGDVTARVHSNNQDGTGQVALNGATGIVSGQSAILSGSANPTAGQTRYALQNLANNSVEADVVFRIPYTCVASALHVNKNSAPGSGETLTVTLRSEGSNTALTAQLANTATEVSDDSNRVLLTKGNTIALSYVASNNGGYVGSRCKATLMVERTPD